VSGAGADAMGSTDGASPGTGDRLPVGGVEWLDIRVGELNQLFNMIDPAPFRERDIDPNAESYVVEWAQEARADRPLGLVVHLGREPATREAANLLGEAFHEYFRRRAQAARQRLRRLFRVGRASLAVGLAFLAGAILLGGFLSGLIDDERYAWIVEESFVIGGWVALWRPLEIFLYDWWPIRGEARLLDRLGEMRLRLAGADGTRVEAGA
jgi:hypothetical protein